MHNGDIWECRAYLGSQRINEQWRRMAKNATGQYEREWLPLHVHFFASRECVFPKLVTVSFNDSPGGIVTIIGDSQEHSGEPGIIT